MCENRLYQHFHIYIDSHAIRGNTTFVSDLNNLYYTNYTISVIVDDVSETFNLNVYSTIKYIGNIQSTILSHTIQFAPNTIAIYINPYVSNIDGRFLFELNKHFLYEKYRGTYISGTDHACRRSSWACKMGILHEFYRQVGLEQSVGESHRSLVEGGDMLDAITDVCGKKNVGKFIKSELIKMNDENITDNRSVLCLEESNTNNTNRHNLTTLDETIHVLLATYERNANIREVLTMLQSQTFKNIHLHILDNNVDAQIQNELDDILKDFIDKLQITVHRPGWNSHCFGRITCIREMMNNYLMEYVVIFDDDQIFDINWIENMVRDRRPLSTLGWYGKTFKICDYWNSTLTYWAIKNKKWPYIKEFTYFGPGGCMLDINLFLFNEIYDYKKYSEDILAIDDIWLSFLFKKYLNIQFHRNMIHPIKCIDWRDHTKMTWANIKDKKQNLMTRLSTAYDWDVTKPTPKTFTVNCVFERVYVLYTSSDNKSRELFNKMNICATYIQVETDLHTAIVTVFKQLLKMNIQTVLVLYEDVVFDDFFHYKFNKYICDMPKQWDKLNIDHIARSKLTSIVGYTTNSMLDVIYQMSESR
jgi:hypothetical protein